ncbi:cyanophycin synthetase [Clostridium fermenticellae]|uniref:Cyanophycin synthetase n=1 Tax=Clostridium fermenticellae TaxID=2068654 RepID=A0A386H0T0_9CLOT|nr:cyanophycin synthetase [Clostridium fermenticellae]AYD39173.1 cyanophycin synthetase [Clostridium fermenticellae]
MKIENFRVYSGRNIYSHKKCIKLCVDLEGYSNIATKDINNFNDRLLQIIPDLKEHRCGIDERNGFVKRLNEGTYLAHVCEHIILAIQNSLGIDVAYGKAREIDGDKYYIIFQYIYKNTAVESAKVAVELINSLICGKYFNTEMYRKMLKDTLKGEELGPSTKAIIDAARRKGIPVMRLGDEGSIFQLGYGKYSRIIEATITSNTKATAVDISCDKIQTKEILYNQCLPVARGGVVKNPLELLFKAEKIGYPVVLKPRYGNQGKGVYVNIKNEKELISIYSRLSKTYDQIIIEENIEGKDYRVCVIDGKVVAVAEKILPCVIGDGVRTVRQLIEKLNRDDKRGEGHEKPLTKVKIDNELKACISRNGYILDDILNNKQKLVLRESANLSTGGEAIDCTDDISQENIEICERAAKAIGLDICGIDICCRDIQNSLNEGGAIIEVNAAPGIRMHHYPSTGKSRDVAGAIVDMLLKDIPKDGMPVVSITGTNGKTTTTRLIGHVLKLKDYHVGMTTTGGVYLDDKCIIKGDTTGYDSAVSVLTNKDVDAAVLETARGGIIRRGLAYDLADVAVITNITEDHLGIDGVNTMEDLAYVKSLVGEAVKKDGYVVMNADDKMSMTIVNNIKSKLIMFSKDKYNSALRENIRLGGYGVYVNNETIYIEKDNEVLPIINVGDIKITLGGKLEYNIENSMAACAALVGLDVDYDTIKLGFKTFECDGRFNPGRFNMYNVNGIKVILDYGHNIAGYKAVISGLNNLEHRRLIGIIGVPGDRTDESVKKVGEISGESFDRIYIKEDKDRRGRKEGEIADILKLGVLNSGFDKDNLEIILDEKSALEKAIDNSKEGDLVIVFFERSEPLIDLIRNRIKGSKLKAESQAVV